MKMENWLVMGGAILFIAFLYPPILGVVAGAGVIVLGTIILAKILGA
jgi:hypothetical protein